MNSSPIAQLPNELLQRIFDHLNLESKLSAALTCRRWLIISKSIFAHLTDVLLIFEDDYCVSSSAVRVQQHASPSFRGRSTNANDGDDDGGDRSINKRANKRQRSSAAITENFVASGQLSVNLCACPHHLAGHRAFFDAILTTTDADRSIKKLIVEDYLLQKDTYVDFELLATFAKRCTNLRAFELHHVDMSRIGEREFLDAIRTDNLTELCLDQCSWTSPSWNEVGVNRTLKSIVSRGGEHLREIRIVGCHLLNDRTLRLMARSCPNLWYLDLSTCRSITADGMAYFFYYLPQRHSDLLYVKICNTRIDGNQLQYRLYNDGSSTAGGGGDPMLRSIRNDRRQWAVCNFAMDTGHRACSFQNRYVPGKSIVFFM